MTVQWGTYRKGSDSLDAGKSGHTTHICMYAVMSVAYMFIYIYTYMYTYMLSVYSHMFLDIGVVLHV